MLTVRFIADSSSDYPPSVIMQSADLPALIGADATIMRDADDRRRRVLGQIDYLVTRAREKNLPRDILEKIEADAIRMRGDYAAHSDAEFWCNRTDENLEITFELPSPIGPDGIERDSLCVIS